MSDLISRSMYKSKLIKALDVLDKDYREAILNEDNDLILAIQNQQSAYMIALRLLDNEPTAYNIDKVVEELKEAMQDLSVIEILSHIDFDSTIQSGLDNFLKAYNSELLRIVKHGCVSDDVCEWKYTKEIMDNAEFKVGCNQNALKRGIVPNNFSYHDFKYCPYCGKKIKVVE